MAVAESGLDSCCNTNTDNQEKHSDSDLESILALEKEAAKPPVACSLSAEELAQRRDEPVWKSAKEVSLRESRLSASFDAEHTEKLMQFVVSERDCCAFFSFRLEFEPNHGPVTISVSGPPEADELIAWMYESVRAARASG